MVVPHISAPGTRAADRQSLRYRLERQLPSAREAIAPDLLAALDGNRQAAVSLPAGRDPKVARCAARRRATKGLLRGSVPSSASGATPPLCAARGTR
jgi:hypothetical protein